MQYIIGDSCKANKFDGEITFEQLCFHKFILWLSFEKKKGTRERKNKFNIKYWKEIVQPQKMTTSPHVIPSPPNGYSSSNSRSPGLTSLVSWEFILPRPPQSTPPCGHRRLPGTVGRLVRSWTQKCPMQSLGCSRYSIHSGCSSLFRKTSRRQWEVGKVKGFWEKGGCLLVPCIPISSIISMPSCIPHLPSRSFCSWWPFAQSKGSPSFHRPASFLLSSLKIKLH